MAYKFQNELRDKAEDFIRALIQAGIDVEPFPAMFRDYLVKIGVGRAGYVNIYYSAKTNQFSLKTHELREKGLSSQIEICWNTLCDRNNESGVTAYQAYVDGSFIDGSVGYGAVILKQGQEVKRFSGTVELHVEQRQVVGELQATKAVLEWCREHQIQGIDIFYDYEGIEKWATGEWRANNPATKDYVDFTSKCSVKVVWHKVKSHSGVYWNEIVDVLAKEGAASKEIDDGRIPQEPLEALEVTAANFVEYLHRHNLIAEFRQIYNGQFARIVIDGGFFDLYNTTNHSMTPRLHAFRDKGLEERAQALWNAFVGKQAEKEVATDPVFEEIEYYLSVLRPYRHHKFDFSPLAIALERVAGVDSNLLAYRDDYDELERIYTRIRTKA